MGFVVRWWASTVGASTHETIEQAIEAEAAKAAGLADDRSFTLTVEDSDTARVVHWTRVGA